MKKIEKILMKIYPKAKNIRQDGDLYEVVMSDFGNEVIYSWRYNKSDNQLEFQNRIEFYKIKPYRY